MKDWKAMELEKGSKGVKQGREEMIVGDCQGEGRRGGRKALTWGSVRGWWWKGGSA